MKVKQDIYDKLSKSEKYCYQKILSLDSKVETLSIHEFCELTNISTATVNRFVKKIGYQNYKDFKKNHFRRDQVSVKTQQQHLLDLITDVSANKIDIIVDKIKKAKKIYFVSFGPTQSISIEATLLLNKLGYKSLALNDTVLVDALLSNSCSKNDLIIFTSFAGEDFDLIQTSESLHNVCYQILLTANPEATLGQTCDLIYCTNAYQYDHMVKSRVTLAIIMNEILCRLVERTK